MGKNNHFKRYLGFSLIFFTVISYAAGKRGEVREVTALKVITPPVIDGKLDDALWRGAALHGCCLSGFLHCNCTKLAKYQPVAFVAYDDKNLYLAVISYVTDISKLKAESTAKQFQNLLPDEFGVIP